MSDRDLQLCHILSVLNALLNTGFSCEWELQSCWGMHFKGSYLWLTSCFLLGFYRRLCICTKLESYPSNTAWSRSCQAVCETLMAVCSSLALIFVFQELEVAISNLSFMVPLKYIWKYLRLSTAFGKKIKWLLADGNSMVIAVQQIISYGRSNPVEHFAF